MFLEADHDAPAVLAKIAGRPDLPEPSYVLHSSPNRVHVFWRVEGFDVAHVEALQKQLARELGTDPAATAATQTTRLSGFMNHKHMPAPVVTIEYLLVRPRVLGNQLSRRRADHANTEPAAILPELDPIRAH